jgi:apolipoprotein N-acyltransferase
MINKKRIGIFFANLFFVGFIVFAAVGYWIKSMYTVGMDVEIALVFLCASSAITLLALLLTVITIIVGKQ